MSKLDDKIALYSKEMTKLGIKVDDVLLRAVTKGCGPSIYNRDSETVSGSDKSELDRVKKNFMEKKLGLSGSDLDEGIAHAIDKIGKSNRNKYRAIFYYLIVKKFKKESVYA